MKLELRNLNQALELKSIYAQLDPHFIFNTLNTGLYFIKKRKTDEAYRHFVSFSQLLRAYIRSSRNKFLFLSEEIVNLDKYITLQQARFDDKFDYIIDVDATLPTTSLKIPALLLQPFVENAINHGLSNKEGKGRLYIAFKKGTAKDELICIIDDNGVGRQQAKAIKEASRVAEVSYGNDLIKELVALINKEAKMHITLDYTDKEPPLEGTTVTITINNTTYES